jgi:hypothetical protein
VDDAREPRRFVDSICTVLEMLENESETNSTSQPSGTGIGTESYVERAWAPARFPDGATLAVNPITGSVTVLS